MNSKFLVIFLFSLIKFSFTPQKKSAAFYRYNRHHHPEFEYLKINRSKSYGIAFSGGGYRAYSASVGQLRALYELGMLEKDKISHISGTSGGTFAPTIFMFRKNFDFDAMTNSISLPESQLTKEYLAKEIEDSDMLVIATEEPPIFFEIPSMKNKKPPYITNSLKEMFFERFCGALSVPMNYYSSPERKNFPYLVINSALLGFNSSRKSIPFETTPLYMGVSLRNKKNSDLNVEKDFQYKYKNRNYDTSAIFRKETVRGGWISPEAFGNETVEVDFEAIEKKQESRKFLNIQTFYGLCAFIDSVLSEVEMKDYEKIPILYDEEKSEFTAADAVGWSSNILGILGLTESIMKKMLKQYSITHIDKNYNVDFKEFLHGDYAMGDNLGVVPLLKRKIENIVLFVNVQTPLRLEKEVDYEGRNTRGAIDRGLSMFFGFDDMTCLLDHYYNFYPEASKLQIFESEVLKEIVKKLKEKKKYGESAIVEVNDVKVLENSYFDIEGGWNLKSLVIYYLDKDERWYENLHEEAKEIVDESEDFPNLPVLGSNGVLSFGLKPENCKLLGNLGYHTTKRYFKKKLSK